ncbi:TPA: hypothetical protein ACGIM3_004944 [Salmonella enterica subsp. enterica serovar Java]
MEQCIIDLGLINYNPAITWPVPIAFFFIALVIGFVFNLGRKSNVVVFTLAMLLPIATVFIFMLLGGKISFC